ncbi:MAG TPA: lmo0937 family membrane protein [Pyrinomonadaceae bacterium]
MLWTILIILLALWLIGLVADVAGGFVHLLLVAAFVVLLVNLFRGRTTTL